MLLSTQGPFPPRTLPRFPGTTDPSATLTARPAPRGVPVDLCCISVRASRVAALFLFHACRRQYPDGNGSVPVSLASPSANGLPLLTGGSTSVLPVSRPARRSLAFRPAWSLNRPRRPFFTRVLQSMSLPPWPALAATNRSDSCWAGFAPARRRRLSTAHVESRGGASCLRPRELLLPAAFATRRCLNLFHSSVSSPPLVKPDVRFSRISAFSRDHAFAHGKPWGFDARQVRP